jgi:Glycosyltransferase family 87
MLNPGRAAADSEPMPPTLRRCLPYGAVVAASIWLASSISTAGDWSGDSWPAVDALAHGRIADYLSAKAMMGPFSTLVQAPFAALGGGDALHAYRWAAFACLLAAGLLGLYLADVARRRGASRLGQVLLAGLCLVNPITIEALQYGHPEEILTAALAVGAVAAASEGHRGRAAVLLGLAVASKQWAVIAILPALMALPDRRVRTGLAAGAIVAALTLPGLVAAPGSFSKVGHDAASAGRIVSPWSVWYPAAGVKTEAHEVGPETLVAHVHEAPPLVGSLSHPLIVLLALILPLALGLRRGGFGLSGSDAMALLALLALLRCALDPLDNLYYHEPLLLALFGWDAFSPGRLPLRGLAGTAIALFFRDWSLHLTDVAAFNDLYVFVIVLAAAAILPTLLRRRPHAHAAVTSYPVSRPSVGSRGPDYLPEEAQISGI